MTFKSFRSNFSLISRHDFCQKSRNRKGTKRHLEFFAGELEKRQLLATFTYSENVLTVIADTDLEEISIASITDYGNYTLTTTSVFSGSDIIGELEGNGTSSLTVYSNLSLNSIQVLDNPANTGASFVFNTSSGNFIDSLSVDFTNANTGLISVGTPIQFTGGANLSLSNANNQVSILDSLSANESSSLSISGRYIDLTTATIATEDGLLSLNADYGTQQSGDFKGVLINQSLLSTAGGSIRISGRGGDAGSTQYGVKINQSSITTTGPGDITINANSGVGNVGDNTGAFFNESHLTTENGTISLQSSSLGNGDLDFGISLLDSSFEVASQGNIQLVGNSGSGNGIDQIGVKLNNTSLTVATGNISIAGTSAGNGTNDLGIWLVGGSQANITNQGNITIMGQGGSGGDPTNLGACMANSCLSVNSGQVEIAADSLFIDTDVIVAANNSGTISVHTMGAGIILGSNNTATALGLTNETINQFSASTISLGNPSTANISIVEPISISGNLALIATGPISESANGSLFVSDSTSINAFENEIALNNATNDFGTVTASGTNITLVDTNALTLGSIAGNGTVQITAQNVTITSTVNATLSGSVLLIPASGTAVDLGTKSAGNFGLTYTEIGNITANVLTIGYSSTGAIVNTAAISRTGNLTLVSSSSITQTTPGNLTISGTANFVSLGAGTAGNITLGNSTNNFGTVKAIGTNITIADSDSITLSNITASGGLTVSGNVSASEITVTGPILATGSAAISLTGRNILILNTSIISNSGDIVLDSNSGTKTGTFSGIRLGNDNDSPANISTTSGNITLIGRGGNTGTDGRGVAILGSSIIGGGGAGKTMNITGYGGNSSEGSKGVNVFNPATRITSTGADINIIGYGGSNGSDNYSIGVDFQRGNVNTTGAGNINVQGYGNSSAGVNIEGGTNITALGTGAISLTGNLSSSATSLRIWDANVVSSGGTISLISDDITISTTQANVNATSSGTVVMKPLNAGTAINLGTTISGSEINRITAGCLTIGSASAGNILVSDAIDRSNSSLGTNLSLISAGTITSTGAGNLAVSGTANFVSSGTGTAGNITLNNATNDFGTVKACGTNITVADSNDLVLSGVTGANISATAGGALTSNAVGMVASGNVNLTANGLLSIGGNAINATSGTGTISLTSSNGSIVHNAGQISAKNDISLNAYGNITIGASGISTSTGTGNVTLISSNDFIYVGGAGISASRNVNLTAAGLVTVTNNAINATYGTGTVSLTSTNNSIVHSGNPIQGKGDITLTASGNVAVGGNITNAAGAGNNTIRITAQNVTITSSVNATSSGSVQLIPTSGTVVDLGTKSTGNFGLTSTEIGNITAGVLTIGNSTTGAIVNTAAISRTNAALGTNLTLISGSSITQT
ncbi:MAG: hypothetical protein WCJ40_12695 [Planctomycetota bacterium]